MAHYEDFVFRGGWFDTIEGFKTTLGKEAAYEVSYNLIKSACGGEMDTDNALIQQFIRGSVMPNVDSAKARYEASVENGKKGGRPQKEIDMWKVDELVKQGQSWVYIANYISKTETSISSEGIRKKYKKWRALQDVADGNH